MKSWIRLWGKKQNQRMAGWWFVGTVGEAAFYGLVCLVGTLILGVVVAWQLFSPETSAFRVGFGFWVMVLASLSMVIIGGTGFLYRVLKVAMSVEHRETLTHRAKKLGDRWNGRPAEHPPGIPALQPYTDSPGVRLKYRLPGNPGDLGPLLLSSLFSLSWNLLTAVLTAVALSSFRSKPEWGLVAVLPLFLLVAFFTSRWFFRLFRRASGIGRTTLEIDQLPLIPGHRYRLAVAQFGRLALRKLEIALVCEEEATYHQGTDVRLERQVIFQMPIGEHGRCRIDYGSPLELDFPFQMPTDVMHSFQSEHNAVRWSLVVQGEANRWPSFCRKFPVVVFPAGYRPPGPATS